MEGDENPKPGPSKPSNRTAENYRTANAVQRTLNSNFSFRSSSSGPSKPSNRTAENYRTANAVQRTLNSNFSIRSFSSDAGRGRPRGNRCTSLSNRGYGASQGRPGGNNRSSASIGFNVLNRIAESDKTSILTILNQNKMGLVDILNSPIHDLDYLVLIINILSKLSQSPFHESKSKFVLEVCNSNFIATLRNYLTDLPYADRKQRNRLYWEDQQKFWENLILFCGDIVDISPATAVRTCRALIESVTKSCLEGLNLNHQFVLPDDYKLKLDEIRRKITDYVDRNKHDTKITNVGDNIADENIKPPEDFRTLSVIPTREDLLDAQPFLRPNIIDGGYADVDDYLDIQFRLLREDCFGPIRVGVDQYLANPNKRKYDHVRVYRNVKFVGPYISNLKIGNLLQIDIEHNKYFRRINWAHSKRFLFGSLVLLTKDRFHDCIMATILDRDDMLLSMGKIPVTIIDSSFGVDINSEDTYTMIESEVYYEPYYHVLRVLQTRRFSSQLPMKEYIVHVNTSSKKPAYLTDSTVFSIPASQSSTTRDVPKSESDEIISTILSTEGYAEINFKVSTPDAWPPKEVFQFNESQYEAYKLALTHEFAVIQGPPGTGKTYLGLKVAEALLRNVKPQNNSLMLVVCYTNHALDQFLEGIAKVTKDIVRIGGQSRNKAMEEFNLMNIRKLRNINTSGASRYFMEIKSDLQKSMDNFQETQLMLDILNNGVINYKALDGIQEINCLCNYYSKFPNLKDPLAYWLFENQNQYYTDFGECISEYDVLNMDANDNEFNMRRKQDSGVTGDKDRKQFMESLKKKYSSFLLIDAKRMLKNLLASFVQDGKQSKDTQRLENDINQLNSQIKLFEDMIKYRSRTIRLNINNHTDFSAIANHTRWCLYFTWIRSTVRKLERELDEYQKSMTSKITLYEEARMMVDMELLKHKKIKVMGLTTSGAARTRQLIQAISPQIVIVEEAAEVLEQHIITSLPPTCQHLILIGDHQQLRPSASYMKLVKKYNIEVSLFERMITNGMHSCTLNVQHRMRPEIAALISPHIYPQLENHHTVEAYSDVLGLEKSVFFFTHEHEEEDNTDDSVSRANHKEADIILGLANYLIQQGYNSDDVTILAAYSGQMFYMRKERQKYAHLLHVKITVVDNYQGEESRIILLSLVRNNSENNIGFLGTENRICVALSRAKQGFYIFGNINMLKMKSELWKKIATTLEENASLGTALNLKCQNHPDEITPVVDVIDFIKVPEGGCTKICDFLYKCGHRCVSVCHGYDREHEDVMKCPNKCERTNCDLNHKCPLYCHEECKPCIVKVPKTLPCGHEQNIFCYREPDDPNNKCLFQLEVVLSLCNHKAWKSCYKAIKDVICKQKCNLRLEKCGHTCELQCHAEKPCSEIDYTCKKDCAKAKKGCQAELTDDLGEHKCMKKCYETCDDCNVQVMKKRSSCKHLQKVACCVNIDAIICQKKCSRVMACGHYCMKKCHEVCGDCKTMVTKEIPNCKHTIKVMCKINVTRELCYEKCTRTRPCGHPCMGRCGADCGLTRCIYLSTDEVKSPCGHITNLPCYAHDLFLKGKLEPMDILKHCNSPCNEDLACGHICSGSCSTCHQGRLHMPCNQTCNQLNICGHQCQEPCNQMCPPCNMPCEIKCAHSRCSRRCGQPCVLCKEKCDRRCAHGACVKLCHQPCAVQACSLPCAQGLACGHRCRGVCGEPCPDICNVCRPELFPKDFTGEEYEDDDKFIVLQDCGHIVELESMDSIMKGQQEVIEIRKCPYCRKPVTNSNRYKELINAMIKNNINPIKKKVYGASKMIHNKSQELTHKMTSIYKKYFEGTTQRGDATILKRVCLQFIDYVRSKKTFFLLHLEMLIVYCDIFEMVIGYWQTFYELKTTTFEVEFRENIEIILKVLKINFHSNKNKVEVKISEQQQKDIGNEMKRLNAIVQLRKLFQVPFGIEDPKVKFCMEAAKTAVFTLSIFDEEKAIESIKTLHETLKSSEIITKLERQMVVKAMGMRAGHWFKCPKGHYYCIGECGGAMETGICPDCKAAVGGTKHTLLPNNSHASEIDGSRFAAYSAEANNIANFELDY